MDDRERLMAKIEKRLRRLSHTTFEVVEVVCGWGIAKCVEIVLWWQKSYSFF